MQPKLPPRFDHDAYDTYSPYGAYQIDQVDRGQETAHLTDYIRIVLQRLPIALAIGITVVLVGGIYTWTRQPRYTASATLLLEPTQVNLTDIKGAIDPVNLGMGRREYIQTQVELMKSRPVAEQVIQQLQLMRLDAFNRASDPAAAFQRIIRAIPQRNTHLVTVEISRPSPREAQLMVNTLIKAYIDDARGRRIGVSEDGLEQLRAKELELRVKLDEATEALQSFMVENDMVSFDGSHNVVMNRLTDLTRQLTQMQPRRMQLQAKVEAAQSAIDKGESITTLPDVIDAPIIRTLKLELSKLGNEYSQMVERLGANHPNLQSRLTQIQALQTKLNIEAEAIFKSLVLQYEQALAEEELLQEAIRQQQQDVNRFNRLSSQFDNLRRVRDSIEGPYTTITRRIEEIDINRMGGQGENIFVVSKAPLPERPSWPNKKRFMLLTLLIAGGLSVGVCFFLDYMDTTIKGDVDVRRKIGGRVLAGIPNVMQRDNIKQGQDLVTFTHPRSHTSEAFRTLRTALSFSIPGERITSVVVSSTLPSEGKSFVAINLAIAHAQSGKRCLLIDADMRKPRLHHVFESPVKKGLSSLLETPDTPVEKAIVTTTIPGLDLLPCGPIPRQPAELLDSERFENLMAQLRERYDFIVFDSPPGFSLVDAMIMTRVTEGMVLVVKSFQTPKAAAEQFSARLHEAKIRLLGVVLNTMEAPSMVGGHYGGYYLLSGRKYAKYYRDEDTTPSGT